MKLKNTGRALFALCITFGLLGSAQSETYWLNIPGSFDQNNRVYTKATSIPVSDIDTCSEAIVQYTKDNLAHYASCDVKPFQEAHEYN